MNPWNLLWFSAVSWNTHCKSSEKQLTKLGKVHIHSCVTFSWHCPKPKAHAVSLKSTPFLMCPCWQKICSAARCFNKSKDSTAARKLMLGGIIGFRDILSYIVRCVLYLFHMLISLFSMPRRH